MVHRLLNFCRIKVMNKIVIGLFLFLSVSSLGSCRFVAPSNQEVSSLNTSGAFSNGAPAWARLPKGQNTNLPQNAGIVPQTFTVPESVSLSANANSSSSVTAELGRGIEEDRTKVEKLKVDEKRTLNRPGQVAKGDSVLADLDKQCPGTEDLAVDALKTEDVQVRIRKYLSLTKRCPRSPDIWVWLAKDYKSLNRFSDARRCVQAALALDAGNAGAKELLLELGDGSAEQ